MTINNRQKNFFSFAFILVLAGAISFYVYKDLHKPAVPESSPEQKPDNTSGLSVETEDKNAGYTISVIKNEQPVPGTQNSFKAPDLGLPIKNYSNLDDTAFKKVSQNMADLVKKLKMEPQDRVSWLNLAIFRKMLGDYSASVEILNYMALLWPKDYVLYNNLADLYQFYIKNYSLAEKNWLKVIELKPDYVQAYENLYGLYKDLYKEKQSQSLPILLQGLAKNPQSTDLMVYIARHYRLSGDNVQAKVYYDKAIEAAKLQNEPYLAVSIKSEAEELKK